MSAAALAFRAAEVLLLPSSKALRRRLYCLSAAAPPHAVHPLVPVPRPEWDQQDHVDGNYERAGLVADVNAAFGRNRRRDVLKEKVEQHPEQLEQEPDDEFKAACSQVRRQGSVGDAEAGAAPRSAGIPSLAGAWACQQGRGAGHACFHASPFDCHLLRPAPCRCGAAARRRPSG